MSNTREHSKLVPERLPVILFTCLVSGCSQVSGVARFWLPSCTVLYGVYLLLWATEERNCTVFLEKGELLTVSCCHTDEKHVTSRAVENASCDFFRYKESHSLALTPKCDAYYRLVDGKAYGCESWNFNIKDGTLRSKMLNETLCLQSNHPARHRWHQSTWICLRCSFPTAPKHYSQGRY